MTTSEPITLQQIFDAAWQAFIVERQPPAQEEYESEHWGCAYHTQDGRRCAIGLVLVDHDEFDQYNGPFGPLVDISEELWADEILEADRSALDHFQARLHDSNCHKGAWTVTNEKLEQIYREVAEDHGLKIPEES